MKLSPPSLCAALVCAAVLLTGCGGGGSQGLGGLDPTELSRSGVTADGLTASISQPVFTIRTNRDVTYTLTLTNTTTQPYTFLSPTGSPDVKPIPVYDLSIKDAAGSTVPPFQGVTPAIVRESFPVTLQPGESAVTTAVVNNYTSPGRYSVTATFHTGTSGDILTPIGPLVISVH